MPVTLRPCQTLHFTIHGKWDICNCPRHRELLVAYWKSYPNFHIAYWNYNTKKQTAEKKPSESQLLDTKLQQIMKMLEQEATRQRSEPSGEYTLETLVRSMVRSETWGDGYGSGAASLKAVNGILIVRNSEAQLKQVENLLLDLKGKLLSK